jgi:hypothetical protein
MNDTIIGVNKKGKRERNGLQEEAYKAKKEE